MTKQISPLRQRMIDDMALRNMSPATQKVYTYAVANFARFHGRSPDKAARRSGLPITCNRDASTSGCVVQSHG